MNGGRLLGLILSIVAYRLKQSKYAYLCLGVLRRRLVMFVFEAGWVSSDHYF